MDLNYSQLKESVIYRLKKEKIGNSNYNIRCKNNINDNNCFINVCFHSILQFNKFITFILNDENFPIYSNTHPIIIESVKLISSYSRISEIVRKEKKNSIINPLNFRKVLADYFEKEGNFQLHSKGDPIELLDILFNFFHSYIATNYNEIGISEKVCDPRCIIHKLFYIDIIEKQICNRCKYQYNIKYDFNNFIHIINVELVFERIKKFNLTYKNISNQLIEISKSSLETKCMKCLNNSLNKQFDCEYLGNYFIINLVWANSPISLEKILKIYCIINKEFNPQSLFNYNIPKKYTFLGMILNIKNHYTCIFYDKIQNCFMFFDDKKIHIFLTWKELTLNLLHNKYFPIVLFYEKEEKKNLKLELKEIHYEILLKYCLEKEANSKNFSENDDRELKEGEWICDCKYINQPEEFICRKCKKNNSVMEMLINEKNKAQNNSKLHNLSLEETKKIKKEVHSNNNIDNDNENDNNNMNQDLNSQSQNESSDDKMIIKKKDSNKSSGFNIIID